MEVTLLKQSIRAGVLFFLFYCLTAIPSSAAVRIDSKPPSPPGGLSMSYRTFTSVSLSWSKSQDDTGVKAYQVFRDGRKIVSVIKNSYTNTDLVPGNSYTYVIKAYDAAGNLSEGSFPLKVSTVSDYQAPSTPSALSASSTDYTEVSLNWEPSSDNTGIKNYEVFRNGIKAATAVKAGCICKGLAPGGKYVFSVKAVDIAGNYSAQSNSLAVETTVDRLPPSMPDGLTAAKVTETEVKLCWSASGDNVKIKGYEIKIDGEKTVKSSHETYTFKNLIPGRTYSFSAAAVDSSGNASAFGKALAVRTIADSTTPSVPGGLVVTSKRGTSVSLAWNASTDNVKVKSYDIYCNGIRIGTTTRKTYTAKILSGFGIYVYTVRACDLADNLSDNSKAVTVISGL